MKRVLVTAAGGAPAWNFIQSLRDAPEPFYIVGVDANKYTLQRSQTDAKYLVPRVNDPDYIPVLKSIVKDEKIEFLHCQMNSEMITISEARAELGARVFLPSHDTIVTCQSKWESYLKWQKAGMIVPKTMFLNSPDDLKKALKECGPKIWIRDISGSAGKGSLPTDDFDLAKRWIDIRKGWGHFVAATCLEAQTVTWQALFNNGDLVVAQGRKRLYWEFADRAPSGVTGITGTGVTVSDPNVDKVAMETIKAIDSKPNGIFGVDLTYDKEGRPNPTEINIGRFFTTHYFFTAAGLNMPYLYVKLGFGEAVEKPKKNINPLSPDQVWVRGMDRTPVLTTTGVIEQAVLELERRRALAHGR